ncbi:TonB-dependent receptor [Desulfosarcina cetonica]|uniref:TonB-dependent receptor n=1 Tax=Desulfosarcina cetonica TaxID=90730 RepID=UPI000B277380|nr:TonB-dependent receptor plug domain-containing protein [Desulfosarcina cetonica]
MMQSKRRWMKRILGALAASVIVTTCAVAQETVEGQVFTLGEVVVTADGSAATSATTVTEVSSEEITAKGASTIAEALTFLPGVVVRNTGKGEAHVSVRGFEQGQVKVLIDGVPARESYFGTVDLSMLPADAISKITITKGASSVLYGANTMGGVINIITKKGTAVPQTAFTAAFGDYRTAHYALNHGGSKGAINYWLSGGYQTSDAIACPTISTPTIPKWARRHPIMKMAASATSVTIGKKSRFQGRLRSGRRLKPVSLLRLCRRPTRHARFLQSLLVL